MGELFSEIGDLVFTLVIGYISAIEFLYVVRHLYHYSCNHDAHEYGEAGENLSQLQDSMRQQLANAKHKEELAGTQVMKDGVPYKDGFRLEAQQALIDQLKEQLKDKALSDLRRQELEKELAKQMKIAQQLRKDLAEAEAKYQQQLKQEEELKAKQLLEEKQKREKEERAKQEAEEQARKLLEAEKLKEAEQRKREKEEEERKKKEAAQQEKEKREREEQQRKEAEEQARKLAEAEKQRELEQRQREEAEEKARQLAEAEKQREAEQRKREEEEREAAENLHRIQEAEKQREAEQRMREAEEREAKENLRKIQEAEKQREKEQRQREEQEAEEAAIIKANEEAEKLLAIEHRLEEQLRAAEKEAELTERERNLIESIKQRELPHDEGNEQREAELLRKILEAREQLGEESEEEQNLRLIQRERDQEAKQRRIEENALLFMEAEKEMADLQAQMLDAVEKREFGSTLDSAPQTPAVEEPCVKRTFSPLMDKEAATHTHTVKTQLAQDLDNTYSVSTKPLLFPGVSDDASSIDPASSQQSSFSTQPSEEITTGTESQYPQQERQEPDGEDTALSNLQYSDDYLRSLDGIKQRPLVREDGSGRRRAFKKRRSSNSSNSSRESRHSRDEELKMFTSLEEEEMKDTADSEFTPIRYTSEPTLKVKGHHRRHKRSPAKDMRHADDSLRSSLERLGEETSDPWGEVKPEHYKHTEFWKREKTLSIDEETEFEKPASSEEVAYDTATNMPSASSFEEATQMQNEEALTALQQHSAARHKREGKETDVKATAKEESARSDNTNLQTSNTAEREASPARSSASPRLRRSPRIEEINQYEERWKENNDLTSKSAPASVQNTPTISVQTPLDFGPWRDEYGLIMEGLSDFYDFTASVNPSRSRSASRNPSPANTAPNTPLPKDVSFQLEISNENSRVLEIYDDTGVLEGNEFKKENVIKFIDSINGNEVNTENDLELGDEKAAESLKPHIQYVADDPKKSSSKQTDLVPLINIIDDGGVASSGLEVNESGDTEMNTLVSGLRSQRAGRSRSRSKSPLPTAGNLQRSLENRRYKMIKHNEDVLEKLIESKLLPELTPAEELEQQSSKDNKTTAEEDDDNCNQEEMNSLVQSLRIDRSRSRSKSPMRLPTAENLSKGLEIRRSRLIERNDELIKQLEERSLTPEHPTIEVEYVYEVEGSEEDNVTTLNTPSISIESVQTEAPSSPTQEEDDCSREKMDLLVQSLRVARSRSRSKSPMRLSTEESINQTIEHKRFYQIQNTEQTESIQYSESLNAPSISIDFAETDTASRDSQKIEDDDCSREQMTLLVQSLREARSRSKSPMPTVDTLNKSLDDRHNNELLRHMEERAKTPEPSALSLEYVYEFEKSEEVERSRHSRSKSPSRSHSRSRSSSPRLSEMELAAYRSNTPSRSVSPQPEEFDEFHVMLNLEGSQIKTLSISSEEQESLILANRQRQLDEEALEKLKNAAEEIELRTLSPLIIDDDELSEQQSQDFLSSLPVTERAKLLRKSPTTPDYDRTISEEMRDIERIKQEMLKKGFKRSTYVGESMDLGSEFEPLRREAALFERSRTPSPSFSAIDDLTAKKVAEEKRKLQDVILQELTSSTGNGRETKSTGAIPKTERLSPCEIELTLTNEVENTMRIEEEMLNSSYQSSTYVGHIIDKTEELEEMRRRNAEFRRSGSASRSPLHESQLQELAGIEAKAVKRELKEKMLHEVAFNDFSRHFNSNFFDNERRASDSALIHKPENLVQRQEDLDLEPEEYHHYRRFSLAQEEPVEQYPNDDYIFIQEVEVRTSSGSRTWLREDFYSEQVDKYLERGEQTKESSAEKEHLESVADEFHSDNEQLYEIEENIPAVDEDEDYSNASDDDRQTVVEVDDEIDEDISDFNERGPAEESHHETSECEEAEREMDRYAGREASDWNRVVDVDDILVNEGHANELLTSEDEGAVGGLSNSPYDSDSFAIDQIYDDAIKNRKQSGILREYDSILSQMSVSSDIDDQYLLWSKTQSKKKPKNIEFNTQFLDNERKDSEMRYLGDANTTARQSTRLRSRYGYNPVLQAKCLEDDVEVDLNYKPKREYNWRKNFKLDEENLKEDKEVTLADIELQEENIDDSNQEGGQWQGINNNEEKENRMFDVRKYSVGGESVTLFSQSPEKEQQHADNEEPKNIQLDKEEVKEEKLEKPKKKKTKKKLHKETKGSLEETMNKEDEEAYDTQLYSRRSSSIQMETDSPKRKSRSRRSSRNSLINEDSLFSPRSSVAYSEPIADIMEEFTDAVKETARPKKIKKRKKVKETMANVVESSIENKEELLYSPIENLNDIPAVSAVITPESSMSNILSTLSPQNSVCVTPASIDSNASLSIEELGESSKENTNAASSSTTTSSPSGNLSRTSSIVTTPVDSFDILKDANFYPLF